MSLYLDFVKKSFQERYIYRFDFYITMFGTLLFIFVQMSVWKALYSETVIMNNIGLNDMLSYVIISLIVTTVTKSGVGMKIAERIETGAIVSDLSRPVNFKYFLWAEDLGNNTFNAIFITLPISLVFWFVNKLSVNADGISISIFSISLVLGIIICFYINFILGLLAFWLQTSWFVTWFLAAFNELFSGSTVPLWFYPQWLQHICEYLPFRLIYFEPIAIFLDKHTLNSAIGVVVTQIFWITILIVLERVIWIKAQNKIAIFGG